MSFVFEGASSLSDVMEFGVRGVRIYMTFRDAVVSFLAAIGVYLVTQALRIYEVTSLLSSVATFIALIGITQHLRFRFGFEWLWYIWLYLGVTGDSPGILGQSRQVRHFTHAWTPGRSGFRSGRMNDLSITTWDEHALGPLGKAYPMPESTTGRSIGHWLSTQRPAHARP